MWVSLEILYWLLFLDQAADTVDLEADIVATHNSAFCLQCGNEMQGRAKARALWLQGCTPNQQLLRNKPELVPLV